MGKPIITTSEIRFGKLIHVPRTPVSKQFSCCGGYCQKMFGGLHTSTEGMKIAIALAVTKAAIK